MAQARRLGAWLTASLFIACLGNGPQPAHPLAFEPKPASAATASGLSNPPTEAPPGATPRTGDTALEVEPPPPTTPMDPYSAPPPAAADTVDSPSGAAASSSTPSALPASSAAADPDGATQGPDQARAELAMQHVLVVEYHTLTTQAHSDNMYVMPVDTFAAQMAALAASRIPVISAHELGERLAYGRDLDRNAVVLTFDDGYQSVASLATLILARSGFPYTLFLIGSRIQDGPAVSGPGASLTLGSLRALQAGGLADLESHTWNLHNDCALECADSPALAADLQRETEWLMSVSPWIPDAFAYPHGATSAASLDIVRQKYWVAFVGSRIPSGFAPADQPWLYPRYLMLPTTDMSGLLKLFFQRHWLYYR